MNKQTNKTNRHLVISIAPSAVHQIEGDACVDRVQEEETEDNDDGE